MPQVPTGDWQYEVPTTGSKRLPPDAGYGKALTNQGYGFEVAIADLIDNSIDAGAHNVVVHFLRDDTHVTSLLIVDDGRGMDEPGLDAAMTVGRRRDYDENALGMYGTGLKAASLSHADALTVISRTRRSRTAGRRLTSAGIEDGFRCDTVDPSYAQQLTDRYDGVIQWQGTIVRWDRVRTFETVAPGQTERYLSEAINRLERHLGLHLHRFLARDDFHLDIVVEHVEHPGDELDHLAVDPLDPFGYRLPGRAGYPAGLTAPVEGLGDLPVQAHIWPSKSKLPGYRDIGSPALRQGFYFYRNDRLVQAGGWNGHRTPENHLSLARVAIDLPTAPNAVFSLDVKKEGVTATPAFTRGLEKAADATGRTFATYLSEAQGVYREGASRAEIERKAVIYPGKGLDPKVRRAVRQELPERGGADPITFGWVPLPADRFFEIDREAHTIQLNKSYRDAFNAGHRNSLNDAPVLKTMLYLLLEDCFALGRWERRRQDKLDYWNTIMLTAVHAQRDRHLDGQETT
ncbi:ATP-binding protein [Streptomyces sp. NPDC050738]|uniref:ATP-binding protein n=1 Tax=Streptomyces sp. NPDC050738 TaxID=3154744 RepID=UPI003430C306